MAGRGGYKQTDGIIVARLSGTARRHSFAGTEPAKAITELQEISTRPDLLAQAAGSAMADYRDGPHISPNARVAADLLLAAGAESEDAQEVAAEVLERRQHAATGWKA